MRNERASLKVCFAAVLASCAGGCYFLSSFDDLQGAGAPLDATTSGSGGASVSSAASSGTGTSSTSASSSASGSGGVAGSGGAVGTGGASNCPPPGADYTGLVMNELAPKGLPDDWIELRNNSAVAIPLCGVMVTQDYDGVTVPDGPDRFTFGDLYLAPGKYVIVASGPELPFGLSKDGPERVTLFAPDGKIIDDSAWIASPSTAFTALESWARIPDGTGPLKRINNPTKGTSNFEIGTGGTGGTGGGV